MDDPIQMPYADYGMTVADVGQTIRSLAYKHPEYELTHYGDILERKGLNWDDQVMSEAGTSELDGKAAMELLLRVVRV
ncbi:hypothetical protein K6V98_02875 [Collinsella sp. AGMB00827]|uniref:Uncharacterized protein n=1 Tax=Collinsella ureilytica TaxID=2869515 RepID=A0ABS7MIW2_9ACTN|nr:hypothetical protein [Collinsella urealyticum]MBY4797309.1 hypothetical protein [Collinsella urealyticum]